MKSKKIYKQIFTIILLCIMFTISFNLCYASSWWQDAWNFSNNNEATNIASLSPLDDILDLIVFVGNIIFIIVTTALGVKYIWGGVESKASVKDSLASLAVAAIFFYGWSTIKDLFIVDGKLIFFASSYQTTSISIYKTILYILNFMAVGGVVYIGLRYMMSGAEGKATLKAQGAMVILGIIMVYATITFLKFILQLAGV